MSDFHVETTVTANKAHACCECRGAINVGERYVRNAGAQDAQGFSYKTCAPCSEARDWLDRTLRSAGLLNSDEGLEFGALQAELTEFASESRFQDLDSLRHLLGMAERRYGTPKEHTLQTRLRENGELIGLQATVAQQAQLIEALKQQLADHSARSLDMVTPAARDVLAERQRQITAEGWTPEHDDEHIDCEMAAAAACYVLGTTDIHCMGARVWPWAPGWWKPEGGYRRMLVKAGALILAEIERLDRAAPASDSREG